jgi:hypothetical protein
LREVSVKRFWHWLDHRVRDFNLPYYSGEPLTLRLYFAQLIAVAKAAQLQPPGFKEDHHAAHPLP